jgi:hypothetical protein
MDINSYDVDIKEAPMKWNVAQAKQHLPEVLRAAEQEPQQIFNRRRFVAAVVDGPTFDEFEQWRKRQAQPTLGERFAELRRICAEENWQMPTVERSDRPNAWAEELADVSLRHQRPE